MKLPRVSASEAIRALKKAGFFLVRQSGSHKIYKNNDNKRVTIPFHRGKIIHLKVLSCILKDADLSVEKFKELMK
jgi:predicted RNA binding protein YcfA (HicA-like mRNA interferase family)